MAEQNNCNSYLFNNFFSKLVKQIISSFLAIMTLSFFYSKVDYNNEFCCIIKEKNKASLFIDQQNNAPPLWFDPNIFKFVLSKFPNLQLTKCELTEFEFFRLID